MSTRLQYILFIIVIILLPHGCSTTTEPEKELQVPGGFEFDFAIDDARAVSGDATPAGGVTIDCADADGVAYSLEVWPGAVSQTTTITMTPLRYLTITEIEPASAAASPAPSAEEGCNVGVWLEPAGLELDSLVVLTITFPDTVTCGVGENLRGIFIDPDRTFYAIVPTDVDTLASTLACTLSHFSLYGTDDVTYEHLKTLIEETTATGLENPTLQITTDLMVCVDEARWGEWPDLEALAIDGTHKILNKFAPIVNQQALATLSEQSVLLWFEVRERASLLGFSDTDSTLAAGMSKVVDKMVSTGKEWCGSEREESGRNMLVRAMEYVMWGLWLETDLVSVDDKIEEIDDAIDGCSDFILNAFPDKNLLYDLALSEDDTDWYIDVMVELMTSTHQPIAGVSLHFYLEFLGEQHYFEHLGNIVTDEDGQGLFRVNIGRDYAPIGDYLLSVSGIHNDQTVVEKIPIEIKKRMVRLTYSYSCNSSHSATDGSSGFALTATYSSTGARAVSGYPPCELVDQSLSHNSWLTKNANETWTRSHEALPYAVSACFFQIYTITHRTDDEFRTPFFVIDKLSVAMRSPVSTRMRRVISEGDYQEDTIITQDAVEYFSLHYAPGPESVELFLDYTDGGFESFSYNYTDSTLTSNTSAWLTVTAALEESGGTTTRRAGSRGSE